MFSESKICKSNKKPQNIPR